MAASINELRQVIDDAPPPVASQEGLIGWRVADGMICAKCASRIIGRGFGPMLRGAESLWEDSCDVLSNDICGLCFQCVSDRRYRPAPH